MKKRILWMLAAIMTFCGAVSFTSCAEEDNPVNPSNEEQEVTELLTGSWICDLDGIEDVDIVGASFNFAPRERLL
jgi:hypothetical protein